MKDGTVLVKAGIIAPGRLCENITQATIVDASGDWGDRSRLDRPARVISVRLVADRGDHQRFYENY